MTLYKFSMRRQGQLFLLRLFRFCKWYRTTKAAKISKFSFKEGVKTISFPLLCQQFRSLIRSQKIGFKRWRLFFFCWCSAKNRFLKVFYSPNNTRRFFASNFLIEKGQDFLKYKFKFIVSTNNNFFWFGLICKNSF